MFGSEVQEPRSLLRGSVVERVLSLLSRCVPISNAKKNDLIQVSTMIILCPIYLISQLRFSQTLYAIW